MALTPSEEGGKLILWHSAPGAGKSFALRSLAKAWAPWCNVNYIMDPETLLSDSAYLMATLLNDDREFDLEIARADRKSEEFRWNLYVLEDAEEFIAADAKAQSGPALGRLLNLTDGLLGQGLGIMILITTNAPRP